MRVRKAGGIFVLVVFLIAAAPISALAAIMPYWTNTSKIVADLSFSNGKGALDASVIGKAGTSGIKATAVLEKKSANGSYTKVKTWDDLSEDGNVLTWGTTYYVAKGYTYRLTVTATVERNGVSETVSVSKTAMAE